MFLIIGLGNPGFRYRKTRHNLGFFAVDYIQKNINDFSKWKSDKKLQAEISRNSDLNIILAKPQTYMNSSGTAVKKLIENWKLIIENCTIIHDDFNLLIGVFKLEQGRSAGGHKGVQSIIDTLGTNDFWRLKIGNRPSYAKASDGKPAHADLPADLSAKALASAEVFPPEADQPLAETKAGDFVLKKFTREEKDIIKKILPEAVKAVFTTLIN